VPNLGPTELIVILVIALLVFGPRRLPDLGRSVGRGLREFKKARDEVTGAIKIETKDLGLDVKDFDPNSPLPPAKPVEATGTRPAETTAPESAAAEPVAPGEADAPGVETSDGGEDEVLQGEIVDDEPPVAPPSAPDTPSAPHDADPA
jgi:sec-independent protein translocase protein TatA